MRRLGTASPPKSHLIFTQNCRSSCHVRRRLRPQREGGLCLAEPVWDQETSLQSRRDTRGLWPDLEHTLRQPAARRWAQTVGLKWINKEPHGVTHDLPAQCSRGWWGWYDPWEATVMGPSDSPYQAGLLFLTVPFPVTTLLNHLRLHLRHAFVKNLPSKY